MDHILKNEKGAGRAPNLRHMLFYIAFFFLIGSGYIACGGFLKSKRLYCLWL